MGGPAGFLKVRGRRYRYPDDREDVWCILTGGATVTLVAVTEDEQVVPARQYRPRPGRILLDLPGGNADGDEPVEVAAAREASYASHRRHAVLARGCRKVAEPKLDDGGFVETVLMSVREFIEHIPSGQPTDTDMAFAGSATARYLKPTV